VHPVSPQFFLEAQRNRTAPFWRHPSLTPLTNTATTTINNDIPATQETVQHDVDNDDNDDIVDMADAVIRETYTESMTQIIQLLRDFTNGLEYQIQFQDRRMLDTLEREGAGLLRLAHNCIDRERRSNLSRSSTPMTWERSTANAMFYRTRLPLADAGT
jgi:hypothetical protein